MERKTTYKRNNWEEIVSSSGLVYYQDYWNEAVYYEFSLEEITELENITNELYEKCLETVQHVIDKNMFSNLGIPEFVVPTIIESWENEVPSIYGRFDFIYDGENFKCLEFNADTPTSLLEASVIQWMWKEHVFPENDQFNSIHERLIDKWKELKNYLPGHILHFTNIDDYEDMMNNLYLMDTAKQAGLNTKHISIQDIGFDGNCFLDLEENIIRSLFKLYPWECIVEDDFGKHLIERLRCGDNWIEPIWKIILSNKGFLPIFSQLFGDSKNIIYSSFTSIPTPYVKKPFFSREGSNVEINFGNEVLKSVDNGYNENQAIYQKFIKSKEFNGVIPIIGSWVIDGCSSGVGIREGGLITNNRSKFTPHIIK